jgi:DNA adenine methylase
LSVCTALENSTVQHADFGDVVEQAEKGDFVYFDPPYYTEENGFTGYIRQQNSGRAEFGAAQHSRLAKVAKELKKKGCFVLISNSESKFIKSVYDSFTIYLVHARNIINCNGNGRGLKRELIITNI